MEYNNPSEIRKLSSELQSELRSGIAITSIKQCVEELVLNAVDGNASNIALRIDFDIFRIQVVDNGNGIPESSMKIIGSRYATSKCHSLNDLKFNLNHYGYRGEALASIIRLSGIVDITSRFKGSSKTFSKLFAYGKLKSLSIPDSKRPSCGTTVTIQDFMYNLPVRKKSVKEAIEIENIKYLLERIVLILPHVSLSLRNDSCNLYILQIGKCHSTLEKFIQIYGKEHEQYMAEVYHDLDQFQISGFIGTQPHQNKNLQFVYVNKRSVFKNKFHSLINDLLNRSSIIKSKVLSNTPMTGPGKLPSSPPKGLCFYGIFVLNITCPRNEYDISFEPTKTIVEFRDWEKLLLCLEEMILKFIKEENLTISLDDRFRRTEKGFTIDLESPLAHSSQPMLNMFSNPKFSHNNDQAKGSLNFISSITDLRTAVQGLPVRRPKVSEKNQKKDTEDLMIGQSTSAKSVNIDAASLNKTEKTNPKSVAKSNEESSNTRISSSLKTLKELKTINSESHFNGNKRPENSGENKKLVVSGIQPLSSLQELKLLRNLSKCDTNDFKTPVNEVGPVNRTPVENDNLDDTLFTDKSLQEMETPSLPSGNPCLSNIVSKKLRDGLKKKKILSSLHKFKSKGIKKNLKGKKNRISKDSNFISPVIQSDEFVGKNIALPNLGHQELNKQVSHFDDYLTNDNQSSSCDRVPDLDSGKCNVFKNNKNEMIFYGRSLQNPLGEKNITNNLSSVPSISLINSGVPDQVNAYIIPQQIEANESLPKTAQLFEGPKSPTSFEFIHPIIDVPSPLDTTESTSLSTQPFVIKSEQTTNKCPIETRSKLVSPTISKCSSSTQPFFIELGKTTRECPIETSNNLSPRTISECTSLSTQPFIIESDKITNKCPIKTRSSFENTTLSKNGLKNQNEVYGKYININCGDDCVVSSKRKEITEENLNNLSEKRKENENVPTNNCNLESISYSGECSLNINEPIQSLKENSEVQDDSDSLQSENSLQNFLAEFISSDKDISPISEVVTSTTNAKQNDYLSHHSSNMSCSSTIPFKQIDSSVSDPIAQTDLGAKPIIESQGLTNYEALEMKHSSSTEDTIPRNLWKHVVNPNGDNIFLNLRTGNSSYSAPPIDPAPAWNASQPMGCPPLKVSITSELYESTAKQDHLGKDFTLTHGYEKFLSSKRKSKSEDRINKKVFSCSNKEPSVSANSNIALIKSIGNENSDGKKDVTCDENRDLLPFKPSVERIDLTSKSKLNGLLKGHSTMSEPSRLNEGESICTLEVGMELEAFARVHDIWEAPPEFPMDAEVLGLNFKRKGCDSLNIRSDNIREPYKFTREMIKKCKVLGQVDKKFIAVTLSLNEEFRSNLLVLVDQHAADERVQLEKLLHQSYINTESSEGKQKKELKSAQISPPVEIILSTDQVRLTLNFRDIFFDLGFDFTQVNETTILFHRLPYFLVAQEPNERYTRRCQTAALIVKSTVVEVCDDICAIGGATMQQDYKKLPRPLPKSLSHVTNTIACKSAIKFGDSLSLQECSSLISLLSECQLPFQCAHGRPSLVPIIDLNYIKSKEKVTKPSLKKLRSL